MVMVSLVTPWGVVAPPLSPTNLGMHGGACTVMFSCSCPPGAHFPLSPSTGRPRESTFWAGPAVAAPVVAPGEPGAAPDAGAFDAPVAPARALPVAVAPGVVPP